MLYANVSVKSEEKEFDFGVISQVALGEKGRGRRLLALTCPEGTELKKNSLVEGLSIGLTKSGKPRIIRKNDDELYLLLSAEGGYTRRGNGTIKVLKNHQEEFEVLSRGNGADGDAGRIGYWDVVLVRAPQNGIIRVRTSGAGYGTPSDLFVIKDGKVYHCHLDTLEECCETIDMELPFVPTKDEYGDFAYNSEEWATL